MIYLAVIYERVNAIEMGDAIIGIGVSGRLQDFAIGTVSAVETLFGENDSPGLTLEEQFGPAEVGDQHFEVFKCDARGVSAERGGLIVPGARVEQVFGIGMESEVPIEIAFGFGALVEVVDEFAAGECLFLVATGITNIPVMLQREINARVGGIFANGGVGDANRAEVCVGDFFHGRRAHVVPEPVRIDFVAHDEVHGAAITAICAGIAIGQKFHTRAKITDSFGGLGVECAKVVWGFVLVARMEQDFV